ncbi:MAG: hypothetical protein ACFFC7_31695 [Candidatus Hermodarchaeota archaeon]
MLAFQHDVGIIKVQFGEHGPKMGINYSELEPRSALFLSMKAFTALYMGVNYTTRGPGKIRGILEIPDTPYFAIGFDVVVLGSDKLRDKRLKAHTPIIFFLIVHKEDMPFFRENYMHVEQSLRQQTSVFKSSSEISFESVKSLKEALIKAFLKLARKGETANSSLFDVSTMLKLPNKLRDTARAILEISYDKEGGCTLKDIVNYTERDEKIEKESLAELMRRGLISISYNKENKPFYHAH